MTKLKTLILLIPLILAGCKEQPAEKAAVRPVKAIQVSDPQLILSRPFPGIARAEDRVNLSFRVGGPLISLPINVGDGVKEGGVLAEIDPRDYQIAVRNAEAELEKAKAQLTFAKSDFARAEKIQKEDPGAISQSKVDEKREERNRMVAVVDGAEAKLEGAKDQLSYTKLLAPYDGIIVAKYFDNFEYVRARESVARMLDTTRIEMVVDIPDSLVPYVTRMKKIEVTFGAFPDYTIEASVKEIGEEASTTTRTFPVTLIMKQPKEVQILAGMSGEARFVGQLEPESRGATLIIPASAVFSDYVEGPTFVWVIDETSGLPSKREVELDRVTSKGVEISDGLTPGEWIATAGIHFIREDQEVEIMGPEEHLP